MSEGSQGTQDASEGGRLVLVTGATGYVGGRLVPLLLEAGYRVRVLVRDPTRLQGRAWQSIVEVVVGDVLDAEADRRALDGVEVAYYLVHAMAEGEGFHRRDVLAARLFGAAAREQGVRRIVYLGGLGDPSANLSLHLRSRHETGEALREGGVPVVELRAAIVVGSGSTSFEMIRYLVERLPIMVCPRWVYTRVQPIGIRDELAYLVAAASLPGDESLIVEVGGADVLTYGEMMLGYAKARGLWRKLIPVPVLTPRLSSYWVHLVTPIPASIAGPLIQGLRNEVVVRDDAARRLFPEIQPAGYDLAVRRTLEALEAGRVETAWSDAASSSGPGRSTATLVTREGMIVERRERDVRAPDADVFRAFTSLGGRVGWLYADVLWQLRGIADRLVGGVGLRRGRRHPTELRVGDALDFWRVEAVEPNHLLRLRAEMKLPGRAWLQFEAQSGQDGVTRLTQSAFFAPRGLSGFAYWYLLYPIHSLIFSGLIERLARRAERSSGGIATKARTR
jgi:uncharacterized protein YbjT (DUF2867 family)/uncharacterized protein YndB with AHSA1/START domain